MKMKKRKKFEHSVLFNVERLFQQSYGLQKMLLGKPLPFYGFRR
jgi:hypothetical protein